MDRLKRGFRRACILPPGMTLVIAPACFALLIWALTHETSPVVDHIAYQLSVYALVITVTASVRLIPKLKRRLGQVKLLVETPLGRILLRKSEFRDWLSLCLTIGWNLLFALVKLVAGLMIDSLWLISLGIYYLLLALLRLTVVTPRGRVPGRAIIQEWQRYRLCGVVLLVMNQVLMVVVILVLRKKGGFNYPGPLIYLMAAYAFWAMTNATVKLVKSHRRDEPLESAARAVSMTAAMVSMLAMETALITRFGEGDPHFQTVMIALTGAVVCLAELFMAIYMIRHGTRRLRELRELHPDL